ncbi:MAG: 3-phosphoshikimate 1-carboxyvinyltransferase [Spirochaetaceae bacterium]|jgi:3-phosphoshikimate 1-carboxyvinyltransferase|nr:3-phosphoshikimate 1-carboxyvinyltransferase [Spirochaetaceae bacterium]
MAIKSCGGGDPVRVLITPRRFSGTIRAPASKSHTIRRLLLAALGEGVSEIDYPLDSLDARSCVRVCRALGAEIEERRAGDEICVNPPDSEGKRLVRWVVRGIGAGKAGGQIKTPPEPLDTGNSGTTLFLALAAAALGRGKITFTGDEQIRRRSAAPLLAALEGLGIAVTSAEGGCAPITVRGPWRGGRVSLSCPTSQYLSALLLAAPLAPGGALTEIEVPLLNEKPYIDMTLSYLRTQGIPLEAATDYSSFRIPGGASYKPQRGPVPGDFSSAAFPGLAAAVSGGPVTILGLDPADPQGDKVFFDILAAMGCTVEWSPESVSPAAAGNQAPLRNLTVSRTGPLKGGVFDLNATPDLLPALAAAACYARGDTALINVAHARIKETDRIAVMAEELGKLGADIEERPDGLLIHGGMTGTNGGSGPCLSGGRTDSRGDHRVVMALEAAALGAAGPVEIDGAEYAAVTYPGFPELLKAEKIT